VPAAHDVHVALDAPPVLKDPAGHAFVHCEVRPVKALYIPAAHSVHEAEVPPPILKEPAGQSPQEPPKHVKQLAVDDAPVLKEPAAQRAVHSVVRPV
jgi:hypothetical protein